MKKTLGAKFFAITFLSAFTLLGLGAGTACAQDLRLSEPEFKNGATVLEALKNRKSGREFDSGRALDGQRLSETLWAAGGINRKAAGGGKPGRTAPSAQNSQSIDIYAFLSGGIYRYEPAAHKLVLIKTGDFRAAAGVQGYVAGAPLNLVYVARLHDVPGGTDTDRLVNAAYDAGHISENVYLYCAASGLNAIVRLSIDRDALRELLGLKDDHEPLLGQTVGFPPQS